MRIRLAQFTSRNGFTLIDAIFTAGAIGLLVVLGFPVWAHSAAEARTRLCVGNLGQIGRAAAMYASEHNDVLPGNQHSRPSWVESLSSYAPTNSYRCPEERVSARSERAFTIALNDFLTPHPYGTREVDFSTRARVPAPAETMMFGEAREEFRAYDHFHFADARENGYKPEGFAEQVDTERHDGTANYLFVDGHVEELAWSSGAKPKLTHRGSRFVRSDGVEEEMGLARK